MRANRERASATSARRPRGEKLRSELERALKSEGHLMAAVVALGAMSIKTVSPAEEKICRKGRLSCDATTRDWLKRLIEKGNDPLGDALCRLRGANVRREKGATYTPPAIVRAMVEWARLRPQSPERIVDPGVGSARFLIAAAKAFPGAELIGVDVDSGQDEFFVFLGDGWSGTFAHGGLWLQTAPRKFFVVAFSGNICKLFSDQRAKSLIGHV
jgi:N-6 DNA Methylase